MRIQDRWSAYRNRISFPTVRFMIVLTRQDVIPDVGKTDLTELVVMRTHVKHEIGMPGNSN